MRRGLLLLIAAGCVALQFGGSLPLSAAALALWLLALVALSRPHLRRLGRPRLWLVSAVMALGSGLLLGKPDLSLGPLRLSSAGLEAGLLMLVRGLFLVALAGWLGSLVVEREVQGGLRRLGLAPFGAALSAAFGLLPSLQARVGPLLAAERGQGWASRGGRLQRAAVELVVQAARAARAMEQAPRLFVAIVGPPGSGKTTMLTDVVARLRAEGVQVGGVLQPAEGPAGARTGYRLRDLGSGEERAFAARGAQGFTFDEEGWRFAARALERALREDACVAIDELGRLEAEGGGHLRALVLPALPSARQVLLLGVRADQAEAIQARLGPFGATVAAGDGEAALEAVVAHVRTHLRPGGAG